MPPFGDQVNAVVQLNNVEVTSLSNYLLAQYGNDKLTVTPEDVQVIREGGAKIQHDPACKDRLWWWRCCRRSPAGRFHLVSRTQKDAVTSVGVRTHVTRPLSNG